MKRVIKWIGGGVVIVIAGLVAVLAIAPPDLLKVGTNYSAKIVCSNVFIAGRDAEAVLADDVQAPGHPLLRFISVDVDTAAQQVEARIFGAFAPARSQYRAGLGCTNLHQANLTAPPEFDVPSLAAGLWPQGDDVTIVANAALDAVLANPDLTGPGHRATVVVHNGRVVAEAYGPGFTADTPLLGWSITKTVTAGLIGTLVQAGQLSLEDKLTGSYDHWGLDDRADISVADMMAMTSGLGWNEGYGSVSDVTAMLYLTDNMAGFAASRDAAAKIGETFNYSSGTSTMLSRVWQDSVGADSLTYPREALFGPLGMTSAVMETDAADTFVGSSYMYATARDWARYGLFLLQGGAWNGQQLLPVGFTDMMIAPNDQPDSDFGRGHIWLSAPGDAPVFEDSVWMRGHDGQSIGLFPSRNLVIVRLGLTPSDAGYGPLPLAQAVIAALEE